MEIVQQPPNGARAARHPARSRGASGAPGPMMPNDLPPREASYQQAQRRLKAGVVEAIVHDLHMTLPWAAGCQGHLTTQEWVSRREFPSAMRCRPFGYAVPFASVLREHYSMMKVLYMPSTLYRGAPSGSSSWQMIRYLLPCTRFARSVLELL
jgi:hypothetical protein